MPLSFPLALADFADVIAPYTSAFKWRLAEYVEHSGTRLGEMIVNEIAPRRWKAEVTLGRMPHTKAAEIQALIEGIGPTGSFFLYNPAQRGPRNDPTGVISDGLSCSVGGVGASRSLQISGVPFNLRVGDMVTVYVSSTRRHLYRFVEDWGNSDIAEVRPFLKTGTAAGLGASVFKASAKMMIEPGSFDPGTEGPTTTTGMNFTAIEVR